MDQMMVLIVFFIGIFLIVSAVIAFFRKLGSGNGEFSFLGVKIFGSGPPVFLFAGIFLMVSARGWHQSLAKVTTLNQKVVETQEETKKVEGERKEIAKTALDLNAKVKEQFELNQKLASRITQTEIQRLAIRPEILAAPNPALSVETLQKLERATRFQ